MASGSAEGSSIIENLCTVEHWMKQIRKNLNSDVSRKTMCLPSFELWSEILELSWVNDKEHKRILGDHLTKENAGQVLTEYLGAMTLSGSNTPTDGYEAECLKIVRSVCANFSEASHLFRLELGRAGLFTYLVAELHAFQDRRDEIDVGDIILLCLRTLHNCAKESGNGIYFERANAIPDILLYTEINSEEVKVTSMLTLAYLMEEKNAELISSRSMIISIHGYLKHAIRDQYAAVFSAEELLKGMKHLANERSNAIKIVTEGVLSTLVKLLQNGNFSEQTVSAELVWRLSFTDENKSIIREEEDMMDILNVLAKQTGVSEVERKLKEAAKGALWVLKKTKAFTDEENSPVTKTKREPMVKHEAKAEVVSGQPPSKHIMISYQWKYQKLVVKIKEHLERENYRVWLDLDKMRGFLPQTMAEAVEKSEVVLLCFSETYKNSLNCRTEAAYAYKCEKCYIPIKVEQGYKPDGWLGWMVAMLFYYDLSEDDLFDTNFPKLVDELGERGKNVGSIIPEKKSIKDWSENDVAEWATNNQIPSIASKNLTGKYLFFLHSIRRTAPEYFFRLITENLKITELEEVEAFCSALEALSL